MNHLDFTACPVVPAEATHLVTVTEKMLLAMIIILALLTPLLLGAIVGSLALWHDPAWMGSAAVLLVAAALLLAAVSGKLLGVHLAGRLLGWEAGEARVVGWLLQTKALILIIFANILLDRDFGQRFQATPMALRQIAPWLSDVPGQFLDFVIDCSGQPFGRHADCGILIRTSLAFPSQAWSLHHPPPLPLPVPAPASSPISPYPTPPDRSSLRCWSS